MLADTAPASLDSLGRRGGRVASDTPDRILHLSSLVVADRLTVRRPKTCRLLEPTRTATRSDFCGCCKPSPRSRTASLSRSTSCRPAFTTSPASDSAGARQRARSSPSPASPPRRSRASGAGCSTSTPSARTKRRSGPRGPHRSPLGGQRRRRDRGGAAPPQGLAARLHAHRRGCGLHGGAAGA